MVEVCDNDDCDSCGRGLAVCIRGEDVCGDLESPPECLNDDGTDRFANPLRRDADGCLWVDARRIFAGLAPVRMTGTAQGTQLSSPSQAFNSFDASYTNATCFDQVVRVEMAVCSALIDTFTGDAVLDYAVAVGDESCTLMSASGGRTHYSGATVVGYRCVAPNETVTLAVTPSISGSGQFVMTPFASTGDITIIFTPTIDIEGECA